MAFMRATNTFNISNVLRRIRNEDICAASFARMSTQSSSSPPPAPGRGTRQSNKTAIIAALGGILSCGGAAYLYKSYTDENFGFENQYKWISNQFGWKEPKLAEKVIGVQTSRPKPETVKAAGSETQADCAEKNNGEKSGDTACLTKMDKEEDEIIKTNHELELTLKDVKPKAMEATEVAVKAYCEAAELIKVFMDKAYCAIEEDNLDSPRFEEVWCDVYDTALKRCEKVKEAMLKGQTAWELICRLREIINNGKSCKHTQSNPLLITAEETLLCAEREVMNAKSRVECIQSESRLVEQYRNLVEDFRRDLKAEVESLLTANPECKETLSDNECAMIITHAYKKVLHVQKELSQIQATSFSDDIAPSDTPAGLALRRRVEELKEYYEGELLSTLARQAQIYQENLQTIKSTMQAEYDRKLSRKSNIAESESLVELRTKNQLVAITLDAMELALAERKSQDDRTQNLRKLWTYCNSLYSQINYAGQSASGYKTSINVNTESLLKEFSGDEFAVLLLKTIPDSVGSSEGLKERFFNKIDKTCRQVAVFKDDERITLWKYIIGYIQGSLISRCNGEKATSKDIYELLDRTGFHLRRGEFLEAVATLNRLEGVPRQVCMDWLRDAITVLETNQTLFALMTHVNSKNVHHQQSS